MVPFAAGSGRTPAASGDFRGLPPTSRHNLAARHFKPLLKRAELPDIRLYDLRHIFATLWLESGEHPKILQEILGHSRISVTLDTYSHVIPHLQREAMGRFGRMFSKSS
jgi:integrase